MRKYISTYQVYRGDCLRHMGLKSDRHGVMIGLINAETSPCESAARLRLARRGLIATHTLTERLFTLARPGDVLTGGPFVYDVVAVEEMPAALPYTAIYVKRRDARDGAQE